MANTQTDLTTKQKLQNVAKEAEIKAEPVKLTATEEAAKKLYEKYDGHLRDLTTKINGYSIEVKTVVNTTLETELAAYKAEKNKLLTPVSPELEQALGEISKWNKIFDLKYGAHQNGKTTFADATAPGLTRKDLDDRIKYENAIKIVAEYIGVKDLKNIVADGKDSGAAERADYEKIQAELVKRGLLSDVDLYGKKVRGKNLPDGKPDTVDGTPGGATTAKLFMAVQKQSIDNLEKVNKALETKWDGLKAKLESAIEGVKKPETKKPEDIVQAEQAVDQAIVTDTKREQEKLTRVINTGNAYRNSLLYQLQNEITDRNERNVAVVALYQDKKVDFKAVKAGSASARDIHKLVEVLAGIEGRHKDYDQANGTGKEKSYRANVKDARKEIEAKLEKIDAEDKKNGTKTDKAQFLLSEAANRLDELLTVKNKDLVYSSKKQIHDFGKQPDLIYESKSASLLADKLRFDNLFELFGIGKDESKKAK